MSSSPPRSKPQYHLTVDFRAGEEWRPVPQHFGYDASSHGRARCWRRIGGCRDADGLPSLGAEPRLLTPKRNKLGYEMVSIGGKNVPVHALVLFAFVGPRPDGMEGCHNNGDNSDNRPENLRWDTHAANMADAVAHGAIASGARHGSKTHPHRLARGDRNGCRTHPERVLRGEQRPGACLSANQVCEIRRLYVETDTCLQDIADRFGVSRSCAGMVARGLCWSHVPGIPDVDALTAAAARRSPRGTRIGGSKLTEASVADIKRRLAARESQSSISLVYGVDGSTVSLISRGRIWAHVQAVAV